MEARPARAPSAARLILQLALVLLGVAGAALLFRNALSTEARLQKLLDRETAALAAMDREAFLALQDHTDGQWLEHRQGELEWRAVCREQGWACGGEPPASRVVGIEVRGQTAWVLLDTTRDGEAVRQVTFFRQGNDGWLHTGPHPEFWGEPAEKHVGHFVWLYRERDEDWVDRLADDGEVMLGRLGEDFRISAFEPITVEVLYRSTDWERPDPGVPYVALPTPLLAGADEQDMRDGLGLELTRYVSLWSAGMQLGEVMDTRTGLLDSLIAWETSRVTGVGLTARQTELLRQAVAANELPGLDQVWPDFSSPDLPGGELRPALGWTAIDYIAARHGQLAVLELLGRLRSVASADEALEKVLRYQDLQELETGWQQHVRDRYGGAN